MSRRRTARVLLLLAPVLLVPGHAQAQRMSRPTSPAMPAPAAMPAPPATPGRPAMPTAAALLAADSMARAEFARDSIGSITVGVVVGDSLVWTRSYGWADMERHIPASRHTVYRVGSITKPFTAVMLLQLVRRGTIRLGDPVDRWLPQVREIRGLPPGARPPTLLQLATMTAGLAREPKREGPFWSGPVSRWEHTLIAALPHTVYDYRPGTKLQYSNIGYAILGAALERAAGVPYVTWERQHVLGPLGMSHSAFRMDPAHAPNLARGYTVHRDGSDEDTTSLREAETGRGYKVPNGALFTTVGDLARFVGFELGYGPASVLPRSALDREFGGIVATSDSLDFGYGVGFMTRRLPDGVVALGHTGAVAGYTAAMEYDRGTGIGVIALRNAFGGRASAGRLALEVLDRLDAGRVHH